MVKSNRYSPTNKKFKSHFENFASKKVKKGHIGKGDRDSEDTSVKKGVLVRIDRKKIYDNGWEVKIDGKVVNCTYGGNVVAIPKSTVTDAYFIPKKTCNVEVQMDTVSKIYSIINIKDVNLTPVALYDDELVISSNTNEDTNQSNSAMIKISKTVVNVTGELQTANVNTDKIKSDDISSGNISSDKLTSNTITASSIQVDGDIKSSNITALESEIQSLKEQINELKGDTNNGG